MRFSEKGFNLDLSTSFLFFVCFGIQNNFLYRSKDVHFQLTEIFSIYQGFPFISLGSISGLPIERKGFTNGRSGSFLFVVAVDCFLIYKHR